jgi:hypothetical protein
MMVEEPRGREPLVEAQSKVQLHFSPKLKLKGD